MCDSFQLVSPRPGTPGRGAGGEGRILIVGNITHHELADITAPLSDVSDWHQYATAKQACAWLKSEAESPDLILLAQARPGELDAAGVEELRRLAPLSGMLAVLGSACEGETRTGKPFPGVLRCYWYEWPMRWREERARIERGELPSWSLPATSSEEERLLERAATNRCTGHIVILADVYETSASLADVLRTCGCQVTIDHPNGTHRAQDAKAILWDTPLPPAKKPGQIAAIRTRFASAPLLILASFPRHHDCKELLQAGASAVIAKPFSLSQLIDALNRSPSGP